MTSPNRPKRSLDRREFLAASVGVGLTSSRLLAAGNGRERQCAHADAKSDRLQAVLKRPRLLGSPSSWQAVEGGLFPVPLERMVIFRKRNSPRVVGRAGGAERSVPTVNPAGSVHENRPRCGRIAKILASYYDLADQEEEWAELLALQDPGEPPASCDGLFLSHLDKHGVSPIIHWWMFVDGQADQEHVPPHMTLVQASSHLASEEAGHAGLYLAHMVFRIHANPGKWSRIANMTHLDATQFLNEQMIKALRGLPA